MVKKLVKFFEGKKILILGFGREGCSTYEFLREHNINSDITIYDKNQINLNDKYVKIIGSETFPDNTEEFYRMLDNFDIIMKTPGIALFDNVKAETKKKITSQTDLFLRFTENTVIGITGTKGKSTTSALTYHILKNAGRDCILMGNIGIPAFSVIKDMNKETLVIYEMSCHQLEYLSASPQIAVLLNIYSDHLDHYTSFDAYRQAKYNIFRFQKSGDLLFVGSLCENTDMEYINSLPIDVYKRQIINY